MLKHVTWFFVFVLIVGLLSGIATLSGNPDTALAQQASSITLQASIGFDGNVKPETWVPVWVRIENNGPGAQGFIQVHFPDSQEKTIYRYPVELPSGARKELIVSVYNPSYAYEAEVAFYTGQQRQANVKLQVNLRTVNDRLIGVAAETPSVFNVLNLIDPPGGDAYVSEVDLVKLPDSALALEALDLIVISGIDSGVMSQAQVQALAGWIANGGRLILFGGPEWQKTTAGFNGMNLLPLQASGTQSVKDWSSFSMLAQSQPEVSGEGIVTTGKVADSAQVLAATKDNVPLIIQRKTGSGEVIFFAVDPAMAPFNRWPGMETLYRYLLGRTMSEPPWHNGISDWYSALNAAQTLPNLSLPPIPLVCGFLVIYVLILGPVNYLIVRKLKRRELGWFTTSGMIIVFSLVVLVSGGLSRSRQPILNRISVLQVWPDSDVARLDGVLGIYSPFRSTYQLDFSGSVIGHGLPNNMSPNNRSLVIYQNAGSGYIPDLRVEVSSIQTVSLEGFIPAPRFEGSLSILVDSSGAALTGRVTNLSELILDKAVLFTSGGKVELGTFQPGETREVRQALNRSLALQPSLTGIYPAKPLPGPSGTIYSPNFYSRSNYAIEDILGTNDFYSSREIYRMYSFVSSLIYNSYSVPSVGNEIYLSGWIANPTLPANLHEVNSEVQDTTLILVRFDPSIETTGNEIQLTPEFFSWTPIDTQSSNYSPYQLYFYGSEILSFAYKPTLAIDFSQVSKLVLHLERQGSTGSVSEVEVYLWDVMQADWEKIPGINWGENEISEPGRFVQPDGTIQVQLKGTGQYVDISRLDFTLHTLTVKK